MTARSIGAVFGAHGKRKQRGDAEHPTDPVRAYSVDVDDRRAKPGRPIGDRSSGYFWAFRDALKRTLKAELARQRAEGQERDDARLHWSFPRVLDGVFKFLDRRTGDCFVDYKSIAEAACCSPSTAKLAIRALERLGFIAHVRRSEVREGAEGQAGPQRKQASNAYYFNCRALMPERIWKTFYKTLQANLTRVTEAAKRRAALILASFNERAMPAPRPSDKSPLMQAVDRVGALAAERWRAQGLSASPE